MKKHLFLSILLCFIFTEYSAGYYAASLTHNHIQGSTYEFRLRVFKDLYTDFPTERNMSVGNDNVTLLMTSQSSFDNYIEINYAGNYTFPSEGEYITEVIIQSRVGGIQNIPNSINTPLVLRNELIVNPDIINNSNIYDFLLIDTTTINQLYLKDMSAIDIEGDSLSFKLSPSNGVPGYSFPGEPSEFSLNNSSGILTWNTPQNYGNYSVLIQIEEWRSGTLISKTEFDLLIVIDFPTDITENLVDQNEVIIYPNPTTNIINFNLNTLHNKISKIEIFDISGKRIYTGLKSITSSTSIDVSSYKKGMYFYTIWSDTINRYDGKFIVE